jgi:hypothetical protein
LTIQEKKRFEGGVFGLFWPSQCGGTGTCRAERERGV